MNKTKRYFFVGVGGVSMCALAKLLTHNGNIVVGSDSNPETKISGIKVFHEHNAENVKDIDCLVYNNAIAETNPEILEAKKLNIPVMSRAELLAEIASEYKYLISVSGMHGKTTTTEMIAEVFLEAGLEPTVHIGGISNCFKSNLYIGKKKFFITEACEYKDSFLTLKSGVGVVLNIEPEHLDYFKNFENIKKSFEKFANNSKKIISQKKYNFNNSINYGENGNFIAKNIKINENKLFNFDIYKNNKLFGNFNLNSIAEHNIENALACTAVCDYFKINKKHIKEALENFKGVKRRMEFVNTSPIVIHDYAHHPTELNATISAVKKHYKKEILVVFQPHTFTRTKAFFKDFVKVLLKADKLFLIKTYSAREEEIEGATAKDLFEKTKPQKLDTYYFEDFISAQTEIKKHLKSNNILLILGAGDIDKMCENFK
ncbi:MAG: UDP-N-acetylmuramate--L-alanine ligase [Clostridia bacterium]|nr:UDP-N-acetylmuramate--L-alanine ligase [Clostridia bacterium]